MDKKVIEKFAIKAREELIKTVQLHLSELGIDNEGIHSRLPESTNDVEIYIDNGKKISGKDITRRQAIVNRLNQLSKANGWDTAYEQFIEEVAYTWFNQVIAIRFMEVNRYLPSNVRVLSSEYGYTEPDILHSPFDVEDDLGGFSEEERIRIQKALDTQQAADLDKAYEILFSKQVNALNSVLPLLFTESKDYLRLLIDPKYASGVIYELVNEVPEADFDVQKDGQVEIIGWLYQYYNEAPKNNAFKKRKYGTYDIPAVTQLFTPDWIVKYLIENSLGRYWIDVLQSRGDSRSEKAIAQDFNWQYYMPAAKQASSNIQISNSKELSQTQPENISFIDPAMGSGHILVYAFDVFMSIYESEGYARREACQSILKHNLYGLDIDTRAYQLTYFSVMMKAKQYDRRIFSRSIHPNVYDVPEIDLSDDQLNDFLDLLPNERVTDKLRSQLEVLLKQFQHGNELGSLINFRDQNIDFQALNAVTDPTIVKGQLSLNASSYFELQKSLKNMLSVARVLSDQYNISVTNPPYMAHGKMPKFLAKFASKQFPNSKSDLFAMFIERLNQLTTNEGYYALVTQHQWMFLSSYEKLRSLITEYVMINMVHMGTHSFEEIGGEVVQSTGFVMEKKHNAEYVGTFERLVGFDSQQKKQDAFLAGVNDPRLKYIYRTNQDNFSKIPGSPIAYWISQNVFAMWRKGHTFSTLYTTRAGMITGNNSRFIRYWTEVSINKIGLGLGSREDAVISKKKWFPYSKGGKYRKWYGNNDYVVNWMNDGEEMRSSRDKSGKIPAHAFNLDYIFHRQITWSAISSSMFSARLSSRGLFDASGSFGVVPDDQKMFQLGFLNSSVAQYVLRSLNPTLNFQKGDIGRLPIIPQNDLKINKLVEASIKLSKADWDMFELSWNFQTHPLLRHIDEHNRDWSLTTAYNTWAYEADNRFNKLKRNEEDVNRAFIKLYGLNEELQDVEDDKDISVRRAELSRDIFSFISFFIGVVFGRYSVDTSGLAYAGGNWDETKYQTYQPNEDDIILLTEDSYFDDNRDVMFRFKEFLVATFGKEHLNENIEFIASALGTQKANVSAEQQIREYFFNDFYKKDHVKMYRKRPIYWEINSGRQGGFRALIYLHRYDENTMATIRTKYLHPLQAAYENKLEQLRPLVDAETTAKSKNQLQKQIDKITKQLDELVKFDAKLQHVANMHIKIDLDDGVLVNHEKVQGGEKILSPIK